MKILIITLSIFWIVTSYAQEHDMHDMSDKHDHSNHEIDKKKIELQQGAIDPNGLLLTVAVEGMVCDFCAQAIQKVFSKKEDVAGVTVDLDNQNVIIALKKNSNMSDNDIEKLFLNAGYNVSEINRKQL